MARGPPGAGQARGPGKHEGSERPFSAGLAAPATSSLPTPSSTSQKNFSPLLTPQAGGAEIDLRSFCFSTAGPPADAGAARPGGGRGGAQELTAESGARLPWWQPLRALHPAPGRPLRPLAGAAGWEEGRRPFPRNKARGGDRKSGHC